MGVVRGWRSPISRDSERARKSKEARKKEQESCRNGGVMAWYHQGLGWNSLIVPNVVEMTERQLEGDDAVVLT